MPVMPRQPLTAYVITSPQDLRVLECWNLETGEHGIVVTHPISPQTKRAADSYRG
jgi:hypothetical protein